MAAPVALAAAAGWRPFLCNLRHPGRNLGAVAAASKAWQATVKQRPGERSQQRSTGCSDPVAQ